jgi:predicted outer membrane repeat protein
MRRILSAAVLWLASGMASGATTYLVRPDGGGDYPTIDAAIQLVPEGSVIELADGTFVGDGNRDLYFRGKAIIVRSQSGDPSRCILDLADSLPHSGFIFQNGEDTLSVLEGVTVRRGRNILGAGVTCWNGGSPRIVGCVFSDNVATDENYGGGAIYCTSAPVIEGCRFLRNASARGGALMVRPGGAPVLRGVTFAENHASVAGGALYLYQCDVRAVDCLFLDNAATDAGGAVLAGHTGDYDFTRCTFSGSTAGARKPAPSSTAPSARTPRRRARCCGTTPTPMSASSSASWPSRPRARRCSATG